MHYENFERGGVTKIQDLVNAYEDIFKYNKESGKNPADPSINELFRGTKITRNNSHRTISFQKIKDDYLHKIEPAGLALFSTEERDDDPDMIFLQVKSLSKFTKYLDTITDFKEVNKDFIGLLISLITKLDTQIDISIKGEKYDHRVKNIMIDIENLVKQIERIGEKAQGGSPLIESLSTINKYLTYYKKDILQEKIKEKELGLDNINNFYKVMNISSDPLAWSDGKDIDLFDENWKKMIHFVQSLKDNEMLRSELDKLVKIIELLQEKIKKAKEQPNKEYLSEYSDILEKALITLKEIENPN